MDRNKIKLKQGVLNHKKNIIEQYQKIQRQLVTFYFISEEQLQTHVKFQTESG